MSVRKEWEQRPQETPKAFHAFMHYRDVEPDKRSIEAAYSEHKSSCLKPHQGGTSPVPSQWKQWSASHAWVARASEYDLHRDALLRETRERELVEAPQRWARYARDMQERAFKALSEKDLSAETARELRLIVSEAARMEREAYEFKAGRNASDIERGIQVWLDATRLSPAQVAAMFAEDDVAS